MHHQESLEFIRLALMDVGTTLPASARIAYNQVAQVHFDVVAAALANQDEKKNGFRPTGDKPKPDLD